MNSVKFKHLIKEKLSNPKVIEILDFFKKGEWPIILFVILNFYSLPTYICDSGAIFETDIFSLINIFLIFPVILFSLNYFLKVRTLYPVLSNFLSASSLTYLMIFLSFFLIYGGLDALISSFPYLFYLYNVAFLYCNSRLLSQIKSKESTLDKIRYLKITSIVLHLISFITYLLVAKDDPLYITTFCCVTPFFIVCLFIKKTESIYLMYRLLFLILFFFLSTLITPYLFVLALFLMWSGKLYYFIRYNRKYPSFYKKYDIC